MTVDRPTPRGAGGWCGRPTTWAYEECMRLIDVERVLASVENALEGGRT